MKTEEAKHYLAMHALDYIKNNPLRQAIDVAIAALDKQTDRTEIIRCQECKYYTPYDPRNVYLDSGCERLMQLISGDTQGAGLVLTEPTDFCSYGERK